MKLKSLFTPLILSAVLLSGCSTTPDSEPETPKQQEERLETLAYEWFEEQSGLSSNDLTPPKKSIMARDYKTNLNAWYEPQVEAQIKNSLEALFESIPDVNFELRAQLASDGSCFSTKLVKKAVKEALPFLITREKGTGAFRELMRKMINMMINGRYLPRYLSNNPYALREIQMEYYYRAAVKLAYVMHNPQFASDYTRGNNILSCAELQSLLSPLILAGASKSWDNVDAINLLEEGFISNFEKVIAFHETSDRFYFILTSYTFDKAVAPLYKSKSDRLYSLECNEIEPKSGDIQDQFKVRGDYEYWLNDFARKEYGLSNAQTELLMQDLGIKKAYKPVNGYRYLTENIPETLEAWHYYRPESAQLLKIEECWIPKYSLRN